MLPEMLDAAELDRPRILQVRGKPRGLTLIPKGLSDLGEPEVVHRDSVVILAVSHGLAFVVETTGDTRERHRVDLDTVPSLLPRPAR